MGLQVRSTQAASLNTGGEFPTSPDADLSYYIDTKQPPNAVYKVDPLDSTIRLVDR